MPGEEIPVEHREGAGIRAAGRLRLVAAAPAGVAHAVDIGSGGAVGLGGHHTAVGILAHAECVGQFHPLHGIDIHRQIPAVDLLRPHPHEHGKQAGHHQPLNVVGVAISQCLAEGIPQTVHLRGGRPEKLGQRSIGPEGVAGFILRHEVPVDAAHILAPANHLPDEPLGSLQGHPSLAPAPLGRGHHIARIEQFQIHAGRQPGVVEPGFTGPDGVLIAAKVGQSVDEKIMQRLAGLPRLHGPVEIGEAAGVCGKAHLHQIDHPLRGGVGEKAQRRW